MNHSNSRNTNTTTWNQSPNVTKDYQHSVPTNRKKKWKIAGIIMVIALLLFLYYLFTDKPVDVAKKFIERTREGDFRGAEELWSKEKVEQINARKNDSRMVEYHMKNFIHYEYDELEDYEILREEKIESDMVQIYVQINFESGESFHAHIITLKEKDKWKFFDVDGGYGFYE